MPPRRISILGVGLLGGSVGLAAKSAIKDCHVVGYGHRNSTLQRALEIGAIDQASTSLADGVSGCDMVILCTPVGVFEQLVPELAGSLDPQAVITDVGSTKRTVVRLGETQLKRGVFVGSHPMAGNEKRGVEFARADLFENALCITTPTPETDPGALQGVEDFWRTIGMRITRLTPEEHDRLLAEVSHLPHALAAALVTLQAEEGLQLAGKGFLDTTRIASGDGMLWRDILLDNRDNVRDGIGKLKRVLGELEKLLEGGKAEELASWLAAAASRRNKLVQQKLREINPD